MGIEGPAAGACIVEGSYGEHSPAMNVLWEDLKTYHAFRCTWPMDPGASVYTNVEYASEDGTHH